MDGGMCFLLALAPPSGALRTAVFIFHPPPRLNPPRLCHVCFVFVCVCACVCVCSQALGCSEGSFSCSLEAYLQGD